MRRSAATQRRLNRTRFESTRRWRAASNACIVFHVHVGRALFTIRACRRLIYDGSGSRERGVVDNASRRPGGTGEAAGIADNVCGHDTRLRVYFITQMGQARQYTHTAPAGGVHVIPVCSRSSSLRHFENEPKYMEISAHQNAHKYRALSAVRRPVRPWRLASLPGITIGALIFFFPLPFLLWGFSIPNMPRRG